MRITTGLLTGHCHLKGHLVKFGLVDSPGCNRCKHVSETFSLVLDGCEALTVLIFSHLDYNFLKSGGFADVSSSPTLCSKCGAAVSLHEGCKEDGKRSRCKFAAVPPLMYSRFLETQWTSLLKRK